MRGRWLPLAAWLAIGCHRQPRVPVELAPGLERSTPGPCVDIPPGVFRPRPASPVAEGPEAPALTGFEPEGWPPDLAAGLRYRLAYDTTDLRRLMRLVTRLPANENLHAIATPGSPDIRLEEADMPWAYRPQRRLPDDSLLPAADRILRQRFGPFYGRLVYGGCSPSYYNGEFNLVEIDYRRIFAGRGFLVPDALRLTMGLDGKFLEARLTWPRLVPAGKNRVPGYRTLLHRIRDSLSRLPEPAPARVRILDACALWSENRHQDEIAAAYVFRGESVYTDGRVKPWSLFRIGR